MQMDTGNLIFQEDDSQINLQILHPKHKRKNKRTRKSPQTSSSNPFIFSFDQQQMRTQLEKDKKKQVYGYSKQSKTMNIDIQEYRGRSLQTNDIWNDIEQNLDYSSLQYNYQISKSSPIQTREENLVFKKFTKIQLSQDSHENLSVELNHSQRDNQKEQNFLKQNSLQVNSPQEETKTTIINNKSKRHFQLEEIQHFEHGLSIMGQEQQKNKYQFHVIYQDYVLSNEFIKKNITRNSADHILNFLLSPCPRNFFMNFLIKRKKNPFGIQLELWVKNTQLLVCKSAALSWLNHQFQIYVTLGEQQLLLYKIVKDGKNQDYLVLEQRKGSEQILGTIALRYSAYGIKKKQLYTVCQSEKQGKFYHIYTNGISKSLRVLSQLEYIKDTIRVARSRQFNSQNKANIQGKYGFVSSKKNIFLFEDKVAALYFGKKQENKFQLLSKGYRSIGQLFAFVVVHMHT